ncbi:hypothetical protein [Streptomyces sp. NBC_00280]
MTGLTGSAPCVTVLIDGEVIRYDGRTAGKPGEADKKGKRSL